ncbi:MULTISPECIES: signal peptidase I [unclassified Sphingomonas]|uniref:signal peptidase I n=1 Tax=unclassified Sphingomonas TaxID=196159 RepID=UPI0021516F06|nr:MULTISPECIES: signal peptidase I [unclassified Sphingomonas]MCR5870323.1 signal peptidase I [Sphingomonas sp. J344]UUX97991.1 signal peptidase I [Sphingomonas sp. J315]
MAEELALTGEGDQGRGGTDWWSEARGIFWLVIAVLGFHSLIAKPFYIPSESMMPTLLVGDRLVVTKYPYGYSYVTPTFHVLPFMKGRLFGSLPERGDVVIVTPTDARSDYIKRVIGLPGDTIEMHGGILYLNGRAVQREKLGNRALKVDGNLTCDPDHYPGALGRDASGAAVCNVEIVRETLPNGASYDTIDIGPTRADNFPALRIPAGHVWLMGDNRDNSADSRMTQAQQGLGGAVPIENIGGRAEFITFSLDGSASWNPLSWAGSFRSGRAGNSLHPDRPEE